MNFDFQCVSYLSNQSFLRNPSVEAFVIENNMVIDIQKYVVYSVGIINNLRIVHALRFIKQYQSPGVTSYYIEWFNIASYPCSSFIYEHPPIETVKFWVHSGVALRKNFFLYQDRMNLYKSTFLYDIKRGQYYRMIYLLPYLKLDFVTHIERPMYSEVDKIFLHNHRKKKQKAASLNYNLISLRKQCLRVIHCHNSFGYLEKSHPRLFEELTKIIN
jgi:hypothetical protein